VVSGQLAWAVATSAGLAALLLASQPAFTALRLAGAAYLVFLGLQALVSAIRSTQPAELTPAARRGARAAFRQGVLSNLGNAKMAVFFTSLLPQFGTTFWTMFPLGLCFAALTLGWLTVYALAVARARRLLRRPRVSRLLDAAMGFVLVSLGLRLAAQR
jgi:threonine/homoserine/homoserine lactone efflux protein